MTSGDILAELDHAVGATRLAITNGTIPDDAYAHGLLDGLAGFRHFARSEKFARLVHIRNKTSKETPTNAHRA